MYTQVTIPAPWKAMEGDTHIKRRQGYLSYLLGVKKVVLVPLRVFSLKRSTVRAFAVSFRVLNQKKLVSFNVLI